MGQSSALSTWTTSLALGQLNRRVQATSGPQSLSSSAESAAGWRVELGGRNWGGGASGSGTRESLEMALPWPGGAGLGVGRPLGYSTRLPSGDTGLSGLGESSIRFALLAG